MLWGLAIVVIAVALAFAALGWWSRRAPDRAPGLVEDRLVPCGTAPNCVCSEASQADDPTHHVAPLALPPGDADARWAAVRDTVAAAGGAIVTSDDDYVHATLRTPVFGFVDDVELRRDGDALHWRSASRVGHSDLGANRRRLEMLRGRIKAAIAGRGS